MTNRQQIVDLCAALLLLVQVLLLLTALHRFLS